jgi:hypothetical protein
MNRPSHSTESDYLHFYAGMIEDIISDYHGYYIEISALPYLNTFPDDFLLACCPDAMNLPATFIIDEQADETFLGIHLSTELRQTLESETSLATLVANQTGLNAFLILAEEISHFHHYVHMLRSQKSLSRLDLELQAELDKILIAALIMKKLFGKPYITELIRLVFDQSIIHGTITDYQKASKIAEKFWKDNLSSFGPNLLFNGKFREHIHKASRISGAEKRRMLEEKVRAA